MGIDRPNSGSADEPPDDDDAGGQADSSGGAADDSDEGDTPQSGAQEGQTDVAQVGDDPDYQELQRLADEEEAAYAAREASGEVGPNDQEGSREVPSSTTHRDTDQVQTTEHPSDPPETGTAADVPRVAVEAPDAETEQAATPESEGEPDLSAGDVQRITADHDDEPGDDAFEHESTQASDSDAALTEASAEAPASDDQSSARAAAGETNQDAETNTAAARTREVLEPHPEVASVVERLIADSAHPLNVTRAIEDPARRDDTLATIRELADGKVLAGRDFDTYTRENPGHGPLFETTAPEVNTLQDGRSRKDAFITESKLNDPAREVGSAPDSAQRELVKDYRRQLTTKVQPAVEADVRAIAADHQGIETSVRAKSANGILDKVERMTSGSEARAPRPAYQTGDVIDAMGARITTRDTKQLAEVMEDVKQRYGTGDKGRILEIENMYASPKESNPSYRVVPIVIRQDVDGQSYAYELQLTTSRASVAADLDHNTTYKPYLETEPEERSKVASMMAEAAALDQEETRRRYPHE